MTTIKIYSNDDSADYFEFLNSDDNREEMEISINIDSATDYYSMWLSKDDAKLLIEYLKKQFII